MDSYLNIINEHCQKIHEINKVDILRKCVKKIVENSDLHTF